jgi:Mg-chelatase subunit ChlD
MKYITTLFALLLCASSLSAQTGANITVLSQRTGDPDAGMGLRVSCNGSPVYDLESSNITVTDNGMNAGTVTVLSSASPTRRDPFSAILVLDVTEPMGGATFDFVREASHAFIQFIDSTTEEAAVLSFGDAVLLQQPVTTSRLALHNAVEGLQTGGTASVYDALFESVEHIATNGTTGTPIAIVITGGGENQTVTPPEDVILLAQARNVRVFVIGLGNVTNQSVLQQIAEASGGSYFAESSAVNLETRLLELAEFSRRGFDEYKLSFTSPDPNATTHRVTVECEACNTTLTDTKVEAVDNITSSGSVPVGSAASLVLGQNTPNPVPSGTVTTIPFNVTSTGAPRRVTLSVFDVLGRTVAMLLDRELSAGEYHAGFDARSLPSGLYFYRLGSGSETLVRKLLIQR